MPTRFTKMHGAGNDFVLLDARQTAIPLSATRIAALSDRQTGIGWDQLILLCPPADPNADCRMQIHNPDGSSAGACGNATRCVASRLAQETGRSTFIIETEAGLLACTVHNPGTVRVDMGVPGLAWQDIPLAHPTDTLHLPLPHDSAAASMGNPHATLFVPAIDHLDAATIGPTLEHHPIFPDRANIGFAHILSPTRIRLRVWERGAGLTRACGSGACAALVNAHRRGLAARTADLLLDGGTLHIEWRTADDHVLMTGPVATAFHGEVDLTTYPA